MGDDGERGSVPPKKKKKMVPGTMTAETVIVTATTAEITDRSSLPMTDATTMTASTDCRVLQLQRETELYEKATKENQLEKEKLQAILAKLVKAKSKKRKDINDDKSRSKKDAHDDDINDGMTILQGKKDNEDDAPPPPLRLSPLPRSLQVAVDTKVSSLIDAQLDFNKDVGNDQPNGAVDAASMQYSSASLVGVALQQNHRVTYRQYGFAVQHQHQILQQQYEFTPLLQPPPLQQHLLTTTQLLPLTFTHRRYTSCGTTTELVPLTPQSPQAPARRLFNRTKKRKRVNGGSDDNNYKRKWSIDGSGVTVAAPNASSSASLATVDPGIPPGIPPGTAHWMDEDDKALLQKVTDDFSKRRAPRFGQQNPWSIEEEVILIKQRKLIGWNDWCHVSTFLPARTRINVKAKGQWLKKNTNLLDGIEDKKLNNNRSILDSLVIGSNIDNDAAVMEVVDENNNGTFIDGIDYCFRWKN